MLDCVPYLDHIMILELICLSGKGYRLLIRGIKFRVSFAAAFVVPSLYVLYSSVQMTLSNVNFKNKKVHFSYLSSHHSPKIF